MTDRLDRKEGGKERIRTLKIFHVLLYGNYFASIRSFRIYHYRLAFFPHGFLPHIKSWPYMSSHFEDSVNFYVNTLFDTLFNRQCI